MNERPSHEWVIEELETAFAGCPGGVRLPSERAVAAQFGIGRGAARGVLEVLRRRGLVRRSTGSGTFWEAPEPMPFLPTEVPSMHAWVSRRGDRLRTEVQSISRRRATKLEWEHLGLAPGSAVWVLKRRFDVNDQPIACATSVLSRSRFPGLDRAIGDVDSLYQALGRRYGMRPSRKWSKASLVRPPEAVRDLFENDGPQECWLVESVNVNDGRGNRYRCRVTDGEAGSDDPIEYARTYTRADYIRSDPERMAPAADRRTGVGSRVR